MPVYTLKGPDNKVYKVRADSPDAAIKGLQATTGLKKDAQKFNDVARNPRTNAAADAFSLGLNRFIAPAVGAADTGVRNVVSRLQGNEPAYSAGDMFNEVRRAQGASSKDFAGEHPVQSLLSGLVGGLAMPGGKAIAGLATPIAKRGLLKGVEAATRGGVIGGGLGAGFGATTAEPGQEAQGAKRGAVAGAVTGGALPAVVSGAGALSGMGRTAVRAANKATGGKILNPQTEAGKRLVQAMKSDGFTPQQMRQAQNEWLKSGVTPTLLDMAGADSQTGALLRGAAMNGAGRRVAQQYNNQVVGNLQDRAIGLADRLTPTEGRSAPRLAADLDLEREATANHLYPSFRQDQLPTESIGDALSGDAGQRALSQARTIADTRRDYTAVAEIDALLAGQSEQVSAGTLDLIRRGIRDAGETAFRGGDKTLAGGLTGRAGDLEGALTEVPGFDQARNAFRDTSQQIDAIDLGRTGMNAKPAEFGEAMMGLPEQARLPAQVGYRQALTDAMGNPTQSATGVLNRLGTSTNQGANLSAAFGDEAAQGFQGGVNRLVEQVGNARSINPGTGSQTAQRMMDANLVDEPKLPTGIISGVFQLINKVRSGATLTDAEREALVQMGVSESNIDDLLPRLVERLSQPQFGSRLAPTLAIQGSREQ